MSEPKRFQEILDYLKEHREASVDELASRLYVSHATVRRDLTAMQANGQVKRTHGGAILREDTDETNIRIRLQENETLKQKITSAALGALPADTNTIFIDNSSTCFLLAQKMNLTHKTVVTNGLEIASYLAGKPNVTVILPGGTVVKSTDSVTGSATVAFLRRIRFDLCLVSCAAFNVESSYEKSLETAEIKRVALSCANKKFLLADCEKFQTTAAFTTGSFVSVPLKTYDLVISNEAFELSRRLRLAGTKLLLTK